MIIASSTFITHWFHFFFWGGNPNPTNVWYERAVWGNVVAVLPLFLMGGAGFAYHHLVLKHLHEEHSEHLKKVLDVLDPESETDSMLDRIADKVDETTPGGLKTILDLIEAQKPKAKPSKSSKSEISKESTK